MRTLVTACFVAVVSLLTGCASLTARKSAPWPRYQLAAVRTWQLNLPNGERFDASGLFLTRQGDLLTVSDRGPGVYRVQLVSGTNAAGLIPLENCFDPAQLAPFAAEKIDRYDCEGVTEDRRGGIYVCEEANRWILRWDPQTRAVERLNIDWSPVEKYFSKTDHNASFEGIAIGDGKLYVANERKQGRIIVVD